MKYDPAMKTFFFALLVVALVAGCDPDGAPVDESSSKPSETASTPTAGKKNKSRSESKSESETQKQEAPPAPDSEPESQTEPEATSADVPLLGVRPGDTFAEATEILRSKARSVENLPTLQDPQMQFRKDFRMEEGFLTLYSDPYPKTPRGETPVASVVLRADKHDFSLRTVRKLYDDYKKEFSQLYGRNRPESHDLGSIQIYNWEWHEGNAEVEIEYQQEEQLPYSTVVKVGI